MSITEADIELTVRVDYDYQPGEPATATYPGACEDIEINSVMLNNIDITKDLLEVELDRIREDILGH